MSQSFNPDAFIAQADTQPARPTVEIDVTSFIPGAEDAGEKVIFTFQEPSTMQIFQAQEDAKKLQRRYEHFTEGLGATCALVAMGHLSPAMTTPKGYFYAELASKKSTEKMFLYIVSQFMQAFPHLKNMDEAIDNAKKSLSAVPAG